MPKVNGYLIQNLDRTIIVSSAAECGYPNSFMLTGIHRGKVIFQCIRHSKETFVNEVSSKNRQYEDYHWVSRMNIKKLHGAFKRNEKNTLYPVV